MADNSKKQKKKSGIVKKLTRFAVGSVAVAMALLVFVQIAFWGAIVWINSKSGQSFVESSLGGQLEDSSYHIKIGGFSYIFPTLSRLGSLELYQGGELLLSAKSIGLDLDIFPINRKKLSVDLNIRQAVIYTVKDKAEAVSPPSKPDIFPIEIERFNLPDIYFTHIELADISIGKLIIKGESDMVISPNISGEILLENKQNIKIDLSYRDHNNKTPDFMPYKIDIDAKFNARRAAFEVENFSIDAGLYALNANIDAIFRQDRDFHADAVIRIKNIENVTPLKLTLNAKNRADFSANIVLFGAYFEKEIAMKSNVSFANGALEIGNIELNAPNLSARGWLRYDTASSMFSGKISGRLERLTSYQSFVGSGHELEPANFDIGLNGKTLNIAIKSNGYSNKSFNVAVKDIRLDASLNEQLLSIKKLALKSRDSGLFKGTGTINLANNYLDLSIKADNFAGIKGDIANGVIDADIVIKGNQEGYKLSGVIAPKKVEIKIPERFSGSIPQLNIEVKGKPEKPKPPKIAKQIELDLVVDAPRQILVRGWGLDAEFGGKLEVKGSAYRPEFYGDFKVLRGRYSEFGKKFKITKAKMKFSGTIPPSPIFDIVTQTKVDDIIAKVLIGGSVMKPKISFSSNPPLPQDEVMSKILFGEDMKNLSPFQAVKLAGTMQRFSGVGGGGAGASAFDPLGAIKSATGLDDLRVETDASGGASVGAGKYLSEKVYLEFEAGSEEGSGNANIQVEVTPNITVESEIGQDARGGAGIFWKRDY